MPKTLCRSLVFCILFSLHSLTNAACLICAQSAFCSAGALAGWSKVALGEQIKPTEQGDAACDVKRSGAMVGISCGGGKADFVGDQTRLKISQDVLDRLLTIDFVTGTFLQSMTENAMLLTTTLLVPASEMGSGEFNLFRPSLTIPKHVGGKLEKRGDLSILSGHFNVSPVAISETSRVLILSVKSERFEGKTISITIQRDDSPNNTGGGKVWRLTNWYVVRQLIKPIDVI